MEVAPSGTRPDHAVPVATDFRWQPLRRCAPWTVATESPLGRVPSSTEVDRRDRAVHRDASEGTDSVVPPMAVDMDCAESYRTGRTVADIRDNLSGSAVVDCRGRLASS